MAASTAASSSCAPTRARAAASPTRSRCSGRTRRRTPTTQSQLNLAVERGARRRGAARASVAALDARHGDGPARRKLRHAGRGFARLPVLVHFNGRCSAMAKVELARSEGLWQGDNATASPWRGFRERHARTPLGGCEAMLCTSGNATS